MNVSLPFCPLFQSCRRRVDGSFLSGRDFFFGLAAAGCFSFPTLLISFFFVFNGPQPLSRSTTRNFCDLMLVLSCADRRFWGNSCRVVFFFYFFVSHALHAVKMFVGFSELVFIAVSSRA